MIFCYYSCETVRGLLQQIPLGFSLLPSLVHLYIHVYSLVNIIVLIVRFFSNTFELLLVSLLSLCFSFLFLD